MRTQAEPLLTPAETAAQLGCHRSTLVNWARSGRLAVVTTLGGHRRYPAADVARAAATLAKPCGTCGTPVRPGRGRGAGTRWYCGYRCRDEEKRRVRARREHARAPRRSRPAVPCGGCGHPYYPVPGKVPMVGGLCSRPGCQREYRRRRYRALRRAEAAGGAP